jgi:hypothetical protein
MCGPAPLRSDCEYRAGTPGLANHGRRSEFKNHSIVRSSPYVRSAVDVSRGVENRLAGRSATIRAFLEGVEHRLLAAGRDLIECAPVQCAAIAGESVKRTLPAKVRPLKGPSTVVLSPRKLWSWVSVHAPPEVKGVSLKTVPSPRTPPLSVVL